MSGVPRRRAPRPSVLAISWRSSSRLCLILWSLFRPCERILDLSRRNACDSTPMICARPPVRSERDQITEPQTAGLCVRYASIRCTHTQTPAKRHVGRARAQRAGGVGEAPSIHEVDPIARSRLYKIAHSARSTCAAPTGGRTAPGRAGWCDFQRRGGRGRYLPVCEQ